MPYIHLQHEMVSAVYDEPSGKWRVRFKRPSDNPSSSPTGSQTTFDEFEDTADLLFTGVGGLSRWNWPDIDGLKSFKGTLVHSAQWDVGNGKAGTAGGWGGWEDDVKDWGKKRVAVIGAVWQTHSFVAYIEFTRHDRARLRSRLFLPYSLASRSYTTMSVAGPGSEYLLPVGRWLSFWIEIRTLTIVRLVRSCSMLERLTTTSFLYDLDTFTEDEIRSFESPEYYRQFRHDLESDLNVRTIW